VVKGENMTRVIHHPQVSANREIVEEDDTDYVTQAHSANVAERIVWFVAGVIETFLALRFIFALLGANPNNGFAQFVYSVSHPFVAPFFNLFNYNYIDNDVGRVEIFTLVAMLVYGIIAALIARLVSINRP
jgi:amino acid permease